MPAHDPPSHHHGPGDHGHSHGGPDSEEQSGRSALVSGFVLVLLAVLVVLAVIGFVVLG